MVQPSARARHQQEAEAAHRQAVGDGDAGMAEELGAAQVAGRDVEIVAAIAGHDLGRHVLIEVDGFERVDMPGQHQLDRMGHGRQALGLRDLAGLDQGEIAADRECPAGRSIAAQVGR